MDRNTYLYVCKVLLVDKSCLQDYLRTASEVRLTIFWRKRAISMRLGLPQDSSRGQADHLLEDKN
jgi:hypothetical protein